MTQIDKDGPNQETPDGAAREGGTAGDEYAAAIDRILALVAPQYQADFLDLVLEGRLSETLETYLETDECARRAVEEALNLLNQSFEGVRQALQKQPPKGWASILKYFQQ